MLLTSFSFLGFDFRLYVHQQSVQRQAVRQDEVADVVATDTERLQRHGLSIFQRHFHSFQVCIHRHVNTCGRKRKQKEYKVL